MTGGDRGRGGSGSKGGSDCAGEFQLVETAESRERMAKLES